MYRQLCCHFWTDPKVRALAPQDKLLFLYLITCPHSHFSGIYYLPVETIKIETGVKISRYPIDTLSIPYLALFDASTSTVWVKNMLKYQWIGKTHVTAIEKHLQTLHYSCLIKSFLEEYAEFRIPYRYPIDTLPVYRNQDQDQDKDKEQDIGGRKKQRPAKATSVPDNFPLTDDLKEWASKNVPNLDMEVQTEAFLDHHRSKGNNFIDWPAAWRKWIRNAAEWGHARVNGRKDYESRKQEALRKANEIRAEMSKSKTGGADGNHEMAAKSG